MVCIYSYILHRKHKIINYKHINILLHLPYIIIISNEMYIIFLII